MLASVDASGWLKPESGCDSRKESRPALLLCRKLSLKMSNAPVAAFTGGKFYRCLPCL